MKKYIREIICILYSLLKFTFMKLFHFNKVNFSPILVFSPFTEIDLGKNSYLKLSRLVKARSGVKLKVREGAKVEVGERTSFNHGCMIISHDEITIGNNVQFGPNVLMYDHDHDFRKKKGLINLKYKTSPINIGNDVWIGANVVILRGTVIGNNCVVGAGSIIKGTYEDNTMIIQKRHESIKQITQINS